MTNLTNTAAVLRTAAFLLLLLLGSCSSAVPADPGLNAKLRGKPDAGAAGGQGAAGPGNAGGAGVTPATAEADEGARRLYLNHCGRCHQPFAPAARRAADWPRYVRRYAPRAGLFGADRARVLAWLQAHAR